MPSLSELTDYDPSPVQPYAGPRLVVTPSNVAPDTDQLPVDTRPEPRPEPMPALSEFNTSLGEKIDKVLNKLTGSDGEERYQLWPEKVVRSGLGAAGDVLSGNVPQWAVDNDTGDVHTSPQMIEKAQEISALAGTGGLAGTTDATLGSAPFLRPALKYEGKIYKAPIKDAENPLGFGAEHSDALPTHLADDFYKKAMSGEDINHYQFGFMNEKGQFLNREKALNHGINTGLVDPQNGKYGVLTSTMLADSSKPGTAIEAMAKAEPFYSAVEHNINAISQAKMTGEQWLGTLSNKPGVKPEELQWTGLRDFLEENKGKSVTKEQVQEHLASNKVELKEVNKGTGELKKAAEDLQSAAGGPTLVKGHKLYPDEIEQGLWDGSLIPKDLPTNLQPHAEKMLSLRHQQESPTKYHSYQLPGAENYREMLLTLPEKQLYNPEFKDVAKNLQQKLIEKYGSVDKIPTHELENLRVARDVDELNHSKSNQYKSSHWDEPNILAHVRMNDRTIDGKKSLHLEEIQSDWHQQGRDKGYKSSDPEKLKKELVEVRKIQEANQSGSKPYEDAVKRESEIINSLNEGVPDAPFKKTWHELALKRMIREAAEKGYDRLSWTPGEAQAARYDLSKSVDKLQYNPTTEKLLGHKGNSLVVDQTVPKEKLADFVGKEAAEKLLNKPTKILGNGYHTLENADLKIGGEGMKGFYDQIIPKSLEKISGQKVKQGSIPSDNIRKTVDDRYTVVGDKRIFDTKAEAEKVANSPVHYIDIPQELKDKAMSKGFPLFSGNYIYTPVSGDPFKSDKK